MRWQGPNPGTCVPENNFGEVAGQEGEAHASAGGLVKP